MRTCYSGPGSECQCVDRSELIGAILDAEGKLQVNREPSEALRTLYRKQRVALVIYTRLEEDFGR